MNILYGLIFTVIMIFSGMAIGVNLALLDSGFVDGESTGSWFHILMLLVVSFISSRQIYLTGKEAS